MRRVRILLKSLKEPHYMLLLFVKLYKTGTQIKCRYGFVQTD